MGRLIPAGTGAMMDRIREIATRRDDLIIERQTAETQATADVPALGSSNA